MNTAERMADRYRKMAEEAAERGDWYEYNRCMNRVRDWEMEAKGERN